MKTLLNINAFRMGGICVLISLMMPATARAADLPAGLDLSVIRSIPVQSDGRWPPLDTVARDSVRKVTGRMDFEGNDPVLTLLAWTIDPQHWMQHPLIPIHNAELRSELELPADQMDFSYVELVNHAPLRRVLDSLSRLPRGQKPDALQSKASGINEELGILDSAFSGRLLNLVPAPGDTNAPWGTLAFLRRTKDPALQQASAAWTALENAFEESQTAAFTDAAGQLRDALAKLPAGFRPSPALIKTELRMNSLRPFTTAWEIMAVSVLLAILSLVVRWRAFDAVVILAILAGFGVLTYGLSLRWQVAGRIPASNMYESLLFLSWGAGPIAMLTMLFIRNRAVPLTVAFMGTLSLFLADVLPLDPFIRPTPPVLMDTVWMSIHVPVIMVSYFVLALAMLIAHGQLVVMAMSPRRKDLRESIDEMHYWYMHVGSILLMVGIVTGSMWAASSWGRYWGWDPKEVWSLIALLGYLTILHVRVDVQKIPAWAYGMGAIMVAAVFVLSAKRLEPISMGIAGSMAVALAALVFFVTAKGAFATAVKSVVAFWGILMTYLGVNYVLGTGLHSYGFGTGAVKKYMFTLGSADLAFVALCALIYLARRSSAPPALSALPATMAVPPDKPNAKAQNSR